MHTVPNPKQSQIGALATSTASDLPVCCFCPEMQKHKMKVVLLEIILLFSAVWSPRQLRVCLKHKANKPWCESCNRGTGCQRVFLRLYKSNSWAALYNKYVYTHLFFLGNRRRPIIISYWNEADTDCERKPNQANSFPQQDGNEIKGYRHKGNFLPRLWPALPRKKSQQSWEQPSWVLFKRIHNKGKMLKEGEVPGVIPVGLDLRYSSSF